MRFLKWSAGVLLALTAVWLAGRMLLDVPLSKQEGRPDPFPDPMDPRTSLEAVFHDLPAEGRGKTELRLLDDNTLAWLERWRLLEDAGTRLDISYFILQQDVFGMSFLGHLVKKTEQGVEIRLLLDAMGTKMSRDFRGNDYLDTLVNTEKVAVRMFRPLPFRYLDAFLTLNPAAAIISAHDKIVLADGRRALIGGRNIGKEYFASPADDPQVFRDTDVVLAGTSIGEALEAIFEAEYRSGEARPVAREAFDLKDSTAALLLAYEAMQVWLHGDPVPARLEAAIKERDLPWLDELRQMPHLRGSIGKALPPRVEADVRLLDSRRRMVKADDFITRTLIRLVRSARREIFIQSPYLVLPKEGAEVFAEAGRRGVAITILTNSPLSSDNAMSQGVFLEQWPELLARVPGLRIFVAGDRHNLHGKLAVFDRELAVVGTYNVDPVSMALNSELAAAAWSAPFAEELLRPREKLIAGGAPRVFEYRIACDQEGNPRRGGDGRAIVEFGPEDHLRPEQMGEAQRYRKLFRWTRGLSRRSPFL